MKSFLDEIFKRAKCKSPRVRKVIEPTDNIDFIL
jgi:hypothetical protein